MVLCVILSDFIKLTQNKYSHRRPRKRQTLLPVESWWTVSAVNINRSTKSAHPGLVYIYVQ